MTSLDTNVLARLILEDDPAQGPRAEALVYTGACFVCDTVLLELAWVLKTAGGMGPQDVARRVRLLIDLPTVSVRDEPAVRAALDDIDAGLDVADAFHRAFSVGAERFVTFDGPFARAADGRPGVPVGLL